MSALNATFWRATFERVLSTALQSLVALFTVGTGILDIDWKGAFLASATITLLTVAKAMIAALATGSPGFGTAEVLAVPGATGESSAAGPVEVVPDPAAPVDDLDRPQLP